MCHEFYCPYLHASLLPNHATTPIPSSYIAKSRRSTGSRVVVDQEVKHSKLHQSKNAKEEANNNVDIQGCYIGFTWEILLGTGTQCGYGEYRGDAC